MERLRTSLEILIFGDRPNHLGKSAAALDQVKLFSLAGLICRERAGDARRVPRWVQSRNGSCGADQSRPELGLRVAPVPGEVCPFELIRVNRQDGVGFLRQPFASARRLENNQQRDRQENKYRKRAEIK